MPARRHLGPLIHFWLLSCSLVFGQDAPSSSNETPWPSKSAAAENSETSDQHIQSIPLGTSPSLVIDLAVEQKWIASSIQPAASIEDRLFARRIYLDLIGRVPQRSELQEFLASTDGRKRERLIDRLLSSDEYATHMAEVFDAILIGRQNLVDWRAAGKAGWLDYLRRSFADNRGWNQIAKEIALARPSNSDSAGAVWYLYSRKNKHQEIAEAVSKDLFGVRIDCAQCHDHPLADEIEQQHYWGLTAFFNRSTNVDTDKGPRVAESAIGGFSEFADIHGSSSENRLVFLRSKTVDEPRPAKETKQEDRDELYKPSLDGEPRIPLFSRRQAFVDEILASHPMVARSMVNRLWGWMFTRGIVHPVDAMDSMHPASHPGLLDWLSRDFEASGYDVRRLLRHFALSRTYQLQSANKTPSPDPKWFGYAIAKPLTAEAFYRSMLIGLQVDHPENWNTDERRITLAGLFPDVLAEESMATVAQGLMLSNSEWINSLVSYSQSQTIRQCVAMGDDASAIDHLFNCILGRAPDAEEVQAMQTFIHGRKDRIQAMESAAWALLTSAEFRFRP